VWITDHSMQSPSRTSIHSHTLTSCLINWLEPKCSARLISASAITKSRFVSKIYPRQPSRRDMVSMNISSCHLDSRMCRHTSCILGSRFSCWNWISLSWYSLMTFWCIQRLCKNMKNTSELYFNSYESTSYMPSSTSVSSGSRKYHSWVT
jgi:hypothetical protein